MPTRAVSALRWVLRATVVGLAAGVVAALVFLALGPPTRARIYETDEIARFSPTLGHGLVQFCGETFLLAVVAYFARRWLRVRL
ncbi:MAG TPA: hypothetical protein VJN95_10150 [Gemmatimonadales bacterium]|nr:hypothetical protein [Gemmatimonadales bacterium]